MNIQSRASKILRLIGVGVCEGETSLGNGNTSCVEQNNAEIRSPMNSSISISSEVQFDHIEQVTDVENSPKNKLTFLSSDPLDDNLLLQLSNEQINCLNVLYVEDNLSNENVNEKTLLNLDNLSHNNDSLVLSPIRIATVNDELNEMVIFNDNITFTTSNFDPLLEHTNNGVNPNDDKENEKENKDYSDPDDLTYEPLEDESNSDSGNEQNNADMKKTVQSSSRKRRKRRHVSAESWEVNMNKLNREAGHQYLGKRKQDGQWNYTVSRKGKTLKSRCHCTGKTVIQCNLISEEQRLKIFNEFWKLSWNEKKVYLKALVEKYSSKRARQRKVENESRRQYSYIYFLVTTKRIRVCKTMFCNTFAISARTIGHWVFDLNKEIALCDKIDEENPTRIETSSEVPCEKKRKLDARKAAIVEKKEDLERFFEILPKMESHYCRKSTSKLYLEPTWTSKMELYRFYTNDWCMQNNYSPVSIATFANVFSDLNLAMFSPKKDECDICVAFKIKNIDGNDITFEEHLVKKEEARHEKDCDKIAENIKVFTMDLQSVLLSPKSNVSSLYYKTKLVVHNFTVFDLKSKEGYCFLWHEGHAGLSSNTFASIIYAFLLTHVANGKEVFEKIVLYSDGCTCQNRNALLSSALAHFSQQMNVTIEQKYLEKGHTQMECDSMHATIERKLRKRTINVPADYVEVCQTARLNPKPYVVQYLEYNFFKNFNKIQILNSIRPGRSIGDPTVTDIRALQYSKTGQINYKLRHTDAWTPLPCRYITKDPTLSYDQLPQLYTNPLPIKAEKYKHLMELKRSLPKDYHSFYDKLPHL